MFSNQGYQLTPLSNKNIHEEVETLKRQTLPALVVILFFYLGIKSVRDEGILWSIPNFIASGLTCYEILKRTQFLQLNTILESLSMNQENIQKDIHSESGDSYVTNEEINSKFSYC